MPRYLPTTNRDTTTQDTAEPSDAALIAAVRAGHTASYGALFRRHRAAATALARQLTGSGEADDLVSDAFIKVQRVLAGGGGPDLAFRPYLLTAVRRLHVDRIRASHRVTPTDDVEKYDRGTGAPDPVVQEFEHSVAARAFSSLPERWQLALWHVEVEGHKPAEVATAMGMTPNGVSALAYRAREGLRQAYLRLQLHHPEEPACAWATDRMAAYLRGGLSSSESSKTEVHLDGCSRCAGVYLELSEMNPQLIRPLGGAPDAVDGHVIGDASATPDTAADYADVIVLAGDLPEPVRDVAGQLRSKLHLAREQALVATSTVTDIAVNTAIVSQPTAAESELLLD